MRELLQRFMDWFRRDRLDGELAEEMAFHARQLEAEERARGISPAQAAERARRQLGSTMRVREAARERWSIPWLDVLQQDVRYALRGLRRSPGFTAAVVVTLALGIGANAAMFGIVDRLMFRPYAMLKDPQTAHRVYLQYRYREREITTESCEYTTYLDLARWSTAYSDFAAFFTPRMAVGVGDEALERRTAAVSASFWSFFDAPPALGRYFGAAEDVTPRGAEVVVLSWDYWQSAFGGRDVRGETLQVGNATLAIIGVTPRGFRGLAEDDAPELYWPITTYAGSRTGEDGRSYFTKYHWGWMELMVRRKAGVSRELADADLSAAYVRSWQAHRDQQPELAPVDVAQPRAIAGPLKGAAGPDPGLEAQTLLWTSGVALIVLLIAAANVTNLFLARVLRRRREVALRLALGVRRWRLALQSVVESVTLALLGAVAGLAVAQWGGLALRRAFVGESATFDLWRDTRTMTVAFGLAVACGVVTGLIPALLGGREDLTSALKAGAREGTHQRSRLRSSLLVLQSALSVVLLVGAALFVRSLQHVSTLRLGYDVDPVLMAVRNMRGMSLGDSAEQRLGRDLIAAARQLPDVDAATYVSSIPFYSTNSTGLFVTGIDSVARRGRFTYQVATPDYFKVMGTRILRGRPFDETDRLDAPLVAVISARMADRLWPGEEAIGKCMRVGADTMPCTSIIGIAENAAQQSLVEEEAQYYLPMAQRPDRGGFAVLMRMRRDPAVAAEPTRRALQQVMPGESYVTARPLATIIDRQRQSWTFGALLFGAFGGLALVVAAVGLYGVISYGVTQRMHELGVRVALGARNGDVMRLVLGQGMRLTAVGVVIGLGLAWLAGSQLQPLLFQQSARDVRIMAAVATTLLAVAVLACGVPARRATRANPNDALRGD